MGATDEAGQTPATGLGLEDRQALVDVTIRYCWAIDGRDWTDLGSVFTEDAVVDYGFMPRVQGLPHIQALVEKVLAPLDSSQHMVSNHQIDVEGEEVRSRCYFHAQHVRRKASGGPNYVIAGIYRDRWSREDAGWRIAARELEVLWTEGNRAVVEGDARG